jgi:hypothetical protein
MHEDMQGYAEQVAFDEKLESLGIFDKANKHWTRHEIDEIIETKRLQIVDKEILRSAKIPAIDQEVGSYFTFRDLIECGETQARTGVENRPTNPNTYNALYDLCEKILDPVVEYFGAIQLTYAFSSAELASKINGRISPKIDQHSSHECNRLGKPICDRLGAAVDFIIQDEDMLEVAQWIVANTPFDRLYFYGRDRPIHVSFSESPTAQVTVMTKLENGRQVPKTLSVEKFLLFTL